MQSDDQEIKIQDFTAYLWTQKTERKKEICIYCIYICNVMIDKLPLGSLYLGSFTQFLLVYN